MIKKVSNCMFKWADNESGFIQCVIKPQYRDDFFALGFVDTADQVKKPQKRKRKVKADESNKRPNCDRRVQVDTHIGADGGGDTGGD